MKDILCIIPARGGSERIPRKNLLHLGGKPLISYTIEAARNANVFTKIVVSSDDPEILAVAEGLGVDTDLRPASLSGNKIRAVEVVEEYLLRGKNREQFDNVAMLLPTCPFRTHGDVGSATSDFINNAEHDFLISVTLYDFPPQLSMNIGEGKKTLIINDPESYRTSTRSQEQKNYYHPNGALYIGKTEKFLEKRTFFADPMMGFIMPPERSFDIDYPYQFQIAEYMMRGIK